MSQLTVEKYNFIAIRVAIIIFILIIIVVPFYESKKIIIWQAQSEGQGYNIFSSFVLQYAIFSEEIKKETGLDLFFNEEYNFWSKIKESPIIFQQNPVPEKENIQQDEDQIKTFIEIVKKDAIFNQAYNFWLGIQKRNEEAKEEQFKKLTSLLADTIKKQTRFDISLFTELKPVLEINNQTDEIQINDNPEKPKGYPKQNNLAVPQNNLVGTKVNNLNALNYLIVGDSFMAIGGGLGDVVEKAVLSYGNTTVDRYGVVSSGLSRPDYFDWNSEIRKLIFEYKPNIIIVMFGANDNQNLTDKKGNIIAKYGGQDWTSEYAKRVDDILDVLKENNINVFWAGLPIMRDKWFSGCVENLNLIYENECQKYQNAYFISTWRTLADDKGNYSAYLKDKEGKNKLARIRDGIHLTYFGGALVTEEISNKIAEVLNQKLSLLLIKTATIVSK